MAQVCKDWPWGHINRFSPDLHQCLFEHLSAKGDFLPADQIRWQCLVCSRYSVYTTYKTYNLIFKIRSVIRNLETMGDVCLEFSKHFPFSLRHSAEGCCPGASFFLDSWAEQETPLQTWPHTVMEWEYWSFSFLCGNIWCWVFYKKQNRFVYKVEILNSVVQVLSSRPGAVLRHGRKHCV